MGVSRVPQAPDRPGTWYQLPHELRGRRADYQGQMSERVTKRRAITLARLPTLPTSPQRPQPGHGVLSRSCGDVDSAMDLQLY